MLKKPTTRKLSEKKVLSAEDRNHNRFRKLFPDEKFYQYPGYPNVYVSQYANIITTYGNTPCWRQPYYDINSGYTSIVLSKHGKRFIKWIHDIVAEVWLKKPSFYIDSPLNVHHNIKVKSNLECQPININFAESLQYVYTKYHKFLDSIESLKYHNGKKYIEVTEPIEIAQFYGVSEYSIFELLNGDPQDIKGRNEYYIKDNIKIKVRKERN